MSKTPKRMAMKSWLVLFFILSMPSSGHAWYVVNDVPERIQEHSNWCWDASSQSMLYYYQSSPTQCSIANWAFNRNDCCGNPTFYWNHQCNAGNYLCLGVGMDDVLQNYRQIYSYCDEDLSESDVNYEADAHRPFGMRFDWKSGGAHALVGRGYSNGYVYYMDPWPGNGYTVSIYSYVVESPQHWWTRTLRLKNPGKPDLVSPSGTITDSTPDYVWNGVTDASWYRLYVRNSAGTVVFDRWLAPNEYYCLDGVCWYTPTTVLPNGTYSWWVLPTVYYSGAWRYGPWSNSKTFTVR